MTCNEVSNPQTGWMEMLEVVALKAQSTLAVVASTTLPSCIPARTETTTTSVTSLLWLFNPAALYKWILDQGRRLQETAPWYIDYLPTYNYLLTIIMDALALRRVDQVTRFVPSSYSQCHTGIW